MRFPSLQIPPDRNQETEERWEFSRNRDFTGGENRQILPEFLKPNQCLIALNMVMTGEGVLETRRGKSAVFTTPLGAGAITSVHRYAKESGTTYLVVQFGTKLYQYAYDGSTQFLTPTELANSLNAAKFRSVVWKDKLILTNGSDDVKVWDGTTFGDLAGSPPKSKYIKVYGSRLRLVDVANPNVIRSSELEDPETWPVLEAIKVRDGDGDIITGISPQDGGLIITKNRSVWPLYGTNKDNYRIPESPLSNSIGCVAPDSLLDEGMFVGANNVYLFDLAGVKEVSDTHRVVIESMTAADRANCFAVYQSNMRRALVHVGAQILCLDDRYQGITSWDTLSAASFAVLDAEGDDGAVLIGDATNGTLYKLDNSQTDDGTPITSTVQHAYLDEGIIHKKQWRYFAPEIESLGTVNSAITFGYDVDYGNLEGFKSVDSIVDNSLVWDEGNWDEKDWGEVLRITDPFYLHSVLGNRISFRITALDRIKYLGYVTKWRRHGDL